MFSPHSISIYEYWTEYILCRRMLHYVCDVFSSLAVLLPIYYNLDLDIESLCRNISRVFSQMQCRELHDHSYYTYRLIFDCSGLSWHEVLDYTCIFFFQNLMMKIFLEEFRFKFILLSSILISIKLKSWLTFRKLNILSPSFLYYFYCLKYVWQHIRYGQNFSMSSCFSTKWPVLVFLLIE